MSGRRLRLCLRIGGWCTATAVVGVVLPEAWMAAAHRALGLGEFTPSPVLIYLIRSVSVLYTAIGLLLVAAARDPQAWRAPLHLLAWSGLLGGPVIGASGALGGLPLWWWLGETVVILIVSAALLWGVGSMGRKSS